MGGSTMKMYDSYGCFGVAVGDRDRLMPCLESDGVSGEITCGEEGSVLRLEGLHFGSDNEQCQADKQYTKIYKFCLDILLMQYKHSIEKWY